MRVSQIDTIGRFTVNDKNKISSHLDHTFFRTPQIRRDTQVIVGKNLKMPKAEYRSDPPIVVLNYFLANPAKMAKFDGNYVVFCSQSVLHQLALLIDPIAYSDPWTMLLERRHHNGKTIFLFWMLDKFNPDNVVDYTIGKNLVRCLIPSTEKDDAKRYFARKLNGIKINDKEVPVYFGAEFGGFRGRDGVKIKAEIKKIRFTSEMKQAKLKAEMMQEKLRFELMQEKLRFERMQAKLRAEKMQEKLSSESTEPKIGFDSTELKTRFKMTQQKSGAEYTKPKFSMSYCKAVDTHVQNHLAGTELTVVGYCYESGRLNGVNEYDNESLKAIYKWNRNYSLEDAMEMVQSSLKSIINRIEKNQRCNFFAIHSNHTIIECSTESLFSPFPDSFLKQ